MGGRQSLESIVKANNIFRGEGLQGRKELKRFEEDPINLGSRGVVGGVGPGIRDTTVDGNDVFQATNYVI